jgi:hypothetical protein
MRVLEAKEIKLMIIENYINWFTSNQEERDSMIEGAKCSVTEDFINEIEE